ncbi:MAG: altronate dehydratase [Pontiellaceae bacterium]|nr:altronate dehydratase [Pontiellaceae bacterium]
MQLFLKIHAADNVAVALRELDAGVQLGDVVPTSLIPAGHKFALNPISAGEPVVKYGFSIGNASAEIAPGDWVHEHNLKSALTGTQTYEYQSNAEPLLPINDGLTFMGYPRSGGCVGIRNELWIIPTVGCVNGLAERAAAQIRAEGLPENVDDVVVLAHPYGCSQLGDDHARSRAVLADLVLHPNAGGVLVVGLGCENNTLTDFKACVGPIDEQRVKFVLAQEEVDELKVCIELLRELRERAASDQRVPCPVSSLRVGLKCGGSDAFSGVTANPLVGAVSDRLIARGVTAVLTEIPEVFGAETVLLNRSVDRSVFDKAAQVVNDFKEYFLRHGEPVGENPSPGNKDGGITTLEDKSLGCVQKGGTAPLSEVLRYGERIGTTGLILLEGPGNDIVAVSALAAAGCHLVLFTTGRGTPLGGVVPVVKIASNSRLAERKKNWIDFNAGALVEGALLDELADRLLAKLLATASGERTSNERNAYRDFAVWKQGVTL